jgi:hypothetical protein
MCFLDDRILALSNALPGLFSIVRDAMRVPGSHRPDLSATDDLISAPDAVRNVMKRQTLGRPGAFI